MMSLAIDYVMNLLSVCSLCALVVTFLKEHNLSSRCSASRDKKSYVDLVEKPGDSLMCTAWTGPQQTLAEPVLCFRLVNYAGMFDCIVPDKCSLQAEHKGSESLGKGRRKSSKHIEFLSNMLQIPLQRKLEHSNRKLSAGANWHVTKEKKKLHFFFYQDSQINY